MKSRKIAEIAVEKTVFSFDKPFDYLLPQNFENIISEGMRVIVPFGKGNSKRQGIVISIRENNFEDLNSNENSNKENNLEKLKEIISVIDEKPVLSKELIKLALYMKEHYFCTIYDAVKTMLPAGINYQLTTLYGANDDSKFSFEELSNEEQQIYNYLFKKRKAVKKESLLEDFGYENSLIFDELVKKGVLYKTDEVFRKVNDAVMKMVSVTPYEDVSKFKLTQKQKNAYELIEMTGSISVKEVCYFLGVTNSVIDALFKKGLVFYYDEEVFRTDKRKKSENISEITLSDEQQNAYNSFLEKYYDDKPYVSLLYGVTGSGKTSVFIKLIEKIINDDKGIIVMVPEISLTPQFVAQFAERFGEKIAVFHSALSLGERLDEYKRVKQGKAKIVIGTRSAIFAPFEKIGLIIMDEEQEYSYKSESSPRYHARDIAKFRCSYNNALLVLSSATPSIETFYYANCDRYSMNTLSKRYGKATLPKVVVADMSQEVQNGNTTGFSEVLLQNIAYNLDHKKQSILLINRRGYNTFVTCRTCGRAVDCPNCSISLTFHSANNRLMCHYCGYSVPYSSKCPTCNSEKLTFGGVGTQRAEKDISEMFPEARILRMDTDATASKSSYEKMISAFAKGEYDILVGTQMVAKGLNFPNVTLVGVLNTDQMLYADDYRSYERTFSLLTQVVGRSGRGNSKGMAVIQTYTPDNLIILMASAQNYNNFYNTEINMRKAMLYPPFADICLVGFLAENNEMAFKGAKKFLEIFVENAKKDFKQIPLRILGPSPTNIAKINNKYRYKIIIKCKNNSDFRKLMSISFAQFEKNREFSKVSSYIDMNALIC